MEIIQRQAFKVKTVLIDIAHYPDGRSEILSTSHNIVVDLGLNLAAGCLGAQVNTARAAGMAGAPVPRRQYLVKPFQ